jgi:hypothetical protein
MLAKNVDLARIAKAKKHFHVGASSVVTMKVQLLTPVLKGANFQF